MLVSHTRQIDRHQRKEPAKPRKEQLKGAKTEMRIGRGLVDAN